MTNERLTGHLSVWIGSRNFGFISRLEGNATQRFFLHRSRIKSGVENARVGAVVHFWVSPIMEGENPCAIDAEIVGGVR
jgi:cold shock CspA family protein